MKICCICGKEIYGFGNNPWPVVDDDEAICCDECNLIRVLPERVELIHNNYVNRNKDKNDG